MAAILPAMVVSYMPTVRLEGVILVIPVANIVALIRDLLLGQQDVPAMTLCLLSTSFYAAVAVMVAARLYGHEAVLFSDVGSYKTLLQRRFFRPQERPWPALALLSVAVIFPVYFYWQSYLADPRAGAGRIRLVLAASQVLILAAPPLLLSWYVRLDLRRTFSLAWPRPMTLLATALLAISVVPVGALANEAIRRLLPGLAAGPEETARLAELLTSGPLAGVLLAFAVLPGICEELLFRGFLLAGLRGRVRPLAAVVVVGVVFGLFHVIAEKIPITSLLGVLLAVLCLRGGSIVPCMLLHMANNGLALSAARIPALAAWLGLPSTGATGAAAEGMRFTPRVCAFAAVFVLGLVVLALDRPGRRAGAGGDG
jgi:sodium transport system permease protein